MSVVEAESEFGYWTLHGANVSVSLDAPAAGAALTKTVPGTVEWEVMAISFLYTASAGVATRIPFVQFLDQGGVAFCDVGSPFTLVATNVSQVTFGHGITQFGANSAVRMGAGIPLMRIGNGQRIRISATAIDAADTITNARLFVRQFRVRE